MNIILVNRNTGETIDIGSFSDYPIPRKDDYVVINSTMKLVEYIKYDYINGNIFVYLKRVKDD